MSRRYVVAAGALAVACYVAGSWLSAGLGVTSSTMLDGLNSPPPYRWVNPPADLAAGNQEPLEGHFPLALTKQGSAAGAFSTADAQATLVISQGAIAPKKGQKSLAVEVKPLDPASLDVKLPHGLEITGNVYQFVARYKPSGEEATELVGGGDQRVLLLYPAEAGKHRAHTIVTSVDGQGWETLPSEDSSAQQQVQAPVTSLGYVAVAAPPEEEGGGLSTSAVGIVVLAVIVLVLGGLVLARNLRRPQGNRDTRRTRR